MAARPPLSPAEERELVLSAKRGEPEARTRLIEAFLPLIRAAARSYRSSRSVDHLELVQEGVVGLLRGLERFEPERGAPFWAYASWWVRQAMQQLVAELTRPVVLSDRALRELSRVRDAYRDHVRQSAAEPALSALADRAGLTEEQTANLLSADRAPRSLDEPLVGEEGELTPLGELLEDPLAEAEYEEVLRRLEAEGLRALLTRLSERERTVLAERHGLDGGEGRTLRGIADDLGLSAERVRQIERRALTKLAVAEELGPAG